MVYGESSKGNSPEANKVDRMARMRPEYYDQFKDVGFEGVRGAEFLRNVLVEIYKGEGVPVTDDFRIDEKAYAGQKGFTSVNENVLRTQNIESKFHEDLLKQGIARNQITATESHDPKTRERFIHEQRIEATGEKVEMLSTILLYKMFDAEQEYLIVRTAKSDDFFGNTKPDHAEGSGDLLIVDRESGEAYCAFDSVGASHGSLFHQKKKKVEHINKKPELGGLGGNHIEYGLSFHNGKLVKTKLDSVPSFYLAMEGDMANRGLREFNPDTTSFNQTEIHIAKLLLSEMQLQIDTMVANPEHFSADMVTKMEHFGNVIDHKRKELGIEQKELRHMQATEASPKSPDDETPKRRWTVSKIKSQ